MWNPENLAQRLNLDGATTRGKKNRMNSPPLRSVWKEWIEQILAVRPNFIIYNEASLPGGDTKKRKNHATATQEAEQFHLALGYQLIIGFEKRGHASHGGAIAAKEGTIITDVKFSFTGGREEQGRVMCIRVQTEKEKDQGKDEMWAVQMYMHNIGTATEKNTTNAYDVWPASRTANVLSA